jgi:hypothetical protein
MPRHLINFAVFGFVFTTKKRRSNAGQVIGLGYGRQPMNSVIKELIFHAFLTLTLLINLMYVVHATTSLVEMIRIIF